VWGPATETAKVEPVVSLAEMQDSDQS